MDVDLNGLKAKLRALFVQFTEFTKTRYSEVNEVSIYGQLLDYEEHRIRENRPVVILHFYVYACLIYICREKSQFLRMLCAPRKNQVYPLAEMFQVHMDMNIP